MMTICKGKCMKIWLDDIRPAPEGYVWCKSVNIAKRTIESAEDPILLIDCDHDLGDYAYDAADREKNAPPQQQTDIQNDLRSVPAILFPHIVENKWHSARHAPIFFVPAYRSPSHLFPAVHYATHCINAMVRYPVSFLSFTCLVFLFFGSYFTSVCFCSSRTHVRLGA